MSIQIFSYPSLFLMTEYDKLILYLYAQLKLILLIEKKVEIMGKYKAGKETKEKIYEASKALFYESGYTDTTCIKIAKASGANVGLINYYFGSKGGLGIEVYNEFMSAIKTRVKEKIDAADIDTTLLLQTAVEIRMINYNMRTNKNFSRFYYDILSENIIYNQESVMTNFYRTLAESCGLHFSEFEIAFITYTNMGASAATNLAYDAGLIDCSSLDFANATLDQLLTTMSLDKNIIAQVIDESYEIEKKISIRIEKNFVIL
ncbi:TetR family transcriptional regulator [Acetobacterium paludosum]|uniref:TetR family transcriptional regulator n=1 Tax=Acetobacterium paludosum TaxID=52693 RepID=A0A923KT72_9FIRM|nr:TetR/AcrR family transcriptional regulator [Acetobacterium paludosum]MBC3889102.1 TetR family transcriptional regulator [Acetobacterium paludosum]